MMKKLFFVTLVMVGCSTLQAMYFDQNLNLRLAINHNDLKGAAAAIKAGADVNQSDTNFYGWTPLDFACRRDDYCIPLIKLLLENKANPNKSAHVCSYCNHWRNHLEIVPLLLQYGADPDETGGDNDGNGLHDAAQLGYVDNACSLLKYGAHVNFNNRNGWTPLHVAANWGTVEVARLLLEHGADFRLKTYAVAARESAQWAAGKTPLEIAQCREKKRV